MRSRPSHVRELIMNKKAAYRGPVDASKWGVRGVWFSGTKMLRPFVWFQRWPMAVTKELCTDNNPKGKITICDLELLGILMHWLALERLTLNVIPNYTCGRTISVRRYTNGSIFLIYRK